MRQHTGSTVCTVVSIRAHCKYYRLISLLTSISRFKQSENVAIAYYFSDKFEQLLLACSEGCGLHGKFVPLLSTHAHCANGYAIRALRDGTV